MTLNSWTMLPPRSLLPLKEGTTFCNELFTEEATPFAEAHKYLNLKNYYQCK